MEIHFILYKPAVPGNIGAAARAMKTMGFDRLRLIDPCDHLSEEARMMAHGSVQLLEQASLFDTFDAATGDLDMVICTTAKGRTSKHDYYSARAFGEFLQNKAGHLNRVGILFGTEESGLPNRLILKCDMAMSIPMAAGYPSLNLAQAVMITAYELSLLNPLSGPGKPLSKSGEGFGELRKQAEQLLPAIGIPEGSALFHRIMERISTTGSNDIPLFLSVVKRINERK